MAYSIQYQTYNGVLEDGFKSSTTQDKTTLPNPLPFCVKENNVFNGWFLDSAFSEPATAGATLTENVTLYAKFVNETDAERASYNLVQPLVGVITPFDATYFTGGININVTLVGGVAVDKLLIKVTDITTSTATKVNLNYNFYDVTDIGDYIRTFNIFVSLKENAVKNNHNYNLTVSSVSKDRLVLSTISQPVFFTCFAKPTLDFYTDSTLTTKFTGFIYNSTLNLYPVFNTQDTNSTATLGYYYVNLYGRPQDGSAEVLLQATPVLYNTGDPIQFNNILPSGIGSQFAYLSYVLRYTFSTSDGMVIENSINCSATYDQAVLSSSYLELENYCGGYIKITTKIDNDSWQNIGKVILTRKLLDNSPLTSNEEIALMTSTYKANFSMIDPYNQSGVVYEYTLYLYDNDGNLLSSTIHSKVYSSFENACVCDPYQLFTLKSGLQYGDYQKVALTGVYEPYGAVYPTIVNNASISYNKGSITVTSLSRSTMTNYRDSGISYLDEVKNREMLNSFLTNRRPKILKDTLGSIWVIYVKGGTNNSFNSSLFNAINDTSYDWVEIVPLTQEGLDSVGMLGYFPLVYSDGTTNGLTTTIGNSNNINI
nr:MAG TPA: hypothetical protein [Caudoviricetes sp.]